MKVVIGTYKTTDNMENKNMNKMMGKNQMNETEEGEEEQQMCDCGDPENCTCDQNIKNNKGDSMFKSIVLGLIEKENLDPDALASWLKTMNRGK